MRAEECRIWRERLGALVLGQLPPDERAATEAHLEGCPACRSEAEALAPVAALLSRADPDRLEPSPGPPSDLAERISRRIAAERRAARRSRVRLALGLSAAAAAVAAIALTAVVLVHSPQSTTPRSVAFPALPKGVSIEATLEPRPWGSDVGVQVRGFRAGTLCRVWLRGANGARVPAGSFRYLYPEEGDDAALSSALRPGDVSAIVLRAGSKTFVAPLHSRSAGARASVDGRKRHA